MTQPELKVEPDELLARARLLETFVLADAFPKDCYPQGPCQLDVVVRARNKIWDSVDTLRDSVREGDAELRLMAEELITAAKKYKECDETAADAITQNRAASATPVARPEKDSLIGVATTADDISGGYDGDTGHYYRSKIYYAGDNGNAFTSFAQALTDYGDWLRSDGDRVLGKGFDIWDGTAAEDAEKNFKNQNKWIRSLADSCDSLAADIKKVVTAYRKYSTEKEYDLHSSVYRHAEGEANYLKRRHHTSGDLDGSDFDSGNWQHPRESTSAYVEKITIAPTKKSLGALKERQLWDERKKLNDALQGASDGVIAGLEAVISGIKPIEPSDPAYRAVRPPPTTDTGAGGGTDGGTDDGKGTDGLTPDGLGTGLPTMPEMPAMPEMPSDVPTDAALSDGVLAGAGAGSSKLPTGGMGMRAASVGGGGGGGGVPSMPLQPPVAAEGAGSAAGRGGPNVGGAGAMGGGAAMGGRGGMGMAPMAGQGGKGEDSKAKRAQQDEEALYAEDRPWTEAVIGNRRRKDGPDNKESK